MVVVATALSVLATAVSTQDRGGSDRTPTPSAVSALEPAQAAPVEDPTGKIMIESVEGRTAIPVIVMLRSGSSEQTIDRVAAASTDPPDVTGSFPSVGAFAATVTPTEIERLAADQRVARIFEDLPIRLDPVSDSPGERPEPKVSDGLRGPQAIGPTPASLIEPSPPTGAVPDLPAARTEFGVSGDAADDGAKAYGPGDVVVAVIDTGIDVRHGDLDEGKVLHRENFVTSTSCAPVPENDDNGHGTHVAGIIAADGDRGVDGQGVAPAAALIDLDVFDCTGSGWTSTILAAVQWAMDHRTEFGIDVVNMSLGSSCYGGGCGYVGDDPMSMIVNMAAATGLVTVVAAGNSGSASGSINAPGLAKFALTAGAAYVAGSIELLASFSSRGPTADGRTKPDVVASGVAVVASAGGPYYRGEGGTVAMSGTSMASPFVAGLAGLVLEAGWRRHVDLSGGGTACTSALATLHAQDCLDGVIDASMSQPAADLIRSTSADRGSVGRDDLWGEGLVSVRDALVAASGGPVRRPPAITAGDPIRVTALAAGVAAIALDLPPGEVVAIDAHYLYDMFEGPYPTFDAMSVDGSPLELRYFCVGFCWGGPGQYLLRAPADGRVVLTVESTGTLPIDLALSRGQFGATQMLSVSTPSSLIGEGEAPVVLQVSSSAPLPAATEYRIVATGGLSATPSTIVLGPSSDPVPVTVTVPEDSFDNGRRRGELLVVPTPGVDVDGRGVGVAAFGLVDDGDPVGRWGVSEPIFVRPDGVPARPVGASLEGWGGNYTTPDGGVVTFMSRDGTLVDPPIDNSYEKAMLFDRSTNEVELVQLTDDDQPWPWSAQVKGLSSDGSRVLLDPWGGVLSAEDIDVAADLYVRDRRTGRTHLVTVEQPGANAAPPCGTFSCANIIDAAFSPDGSAVAWASAIPFGPDDTDGQVDVYLRDLDRGVTERVSITTTGATGWRRHRRRPFMSR